MIYASSDTESKESSPNFKRKKHSLKKLRKQNSFSAVIHKSKSISPDIFENIPIQNIEKSFSLTINIDREHSASAKYPSVKNVQTPIDLSYYSPLFDIPYIPNVKRRSAGAINNDIIGTSAIDMSRKSLSYRSLSPNPYYSHVHHGYHHRKKKHKKHRIKKYDLMPERMKSCENSLFSNADIMDFSQLLPDSKLKLISCHSWSSSPPIQPLFDVNDEHMGNYLISKTPPAPIVHLMANSGEVLSFIKVDEKSEVRMKSMSMIDENENDLQNI